MEVYKIAAFLGFVFGLAALIMSIINMRNIENDSGSADSPPKTGTGAPSLPSTDVSDLITSLQEIENDVNIVNNSLDTVNNSLDVIQSFQDQNTDQVELIDDRVKLNSTEIQALEDNAIASGDTFNALDSTVSSVSDLLNTQVSYTSNHGSRLDSLEISLSENSGLISDNTNEVTDNAIAISSLTDTVSSNASDITTALDGVSDNAVSISTLTNAVTTNTGNITTALDGVSDNADSITTNSLLLATVSPTLESYSNLLQGATVQSSVKTKREIQDINGSLGRVAITNLTPEITLKGTNSKILVRCSLSVGPSGNNAYWGGFLYRSINGSAYSEVSDARGNTLGPGTACWIANTGGFSDFGINSASAVYYDERDYNVSDIVRYRVVLDARLGDNDGSQAIKVNAAYNFNDAFRACTTTTLEAHEIYG